MNTTGLNSKESMNEILASASEMEGKYLTFWIDKQLFGVPIADVMQIVGMQAITEIPEFPDYAKGIINLRGSIIPLIDVRLRINKAEEEYNERTCIIVCSINEKQLGFIVDEVNEVTAIDNENIDPPPLISESSSNAYVTGVAKHGNNIVLLMDVCRMLTGETLEGLLQAGSRAGE